MTSRFATAMADTATTWNGARSFATPDPTGTSSGRVSLYFKSVRGLNAPRLYEYLGAAASEDVTDAFLLAFHIRDCRGGKGERDLGRQALVWLFLNYPDEFMRVVPLMAEYGRWDDILQFWPSVLDLRDLIFVRKNWASTVPDARALKKLRGLQDQFVLLVYDQLTADVANLKEGKPVSLCAKWAPTEGDALDCEHSVVQTLCRVGKMTPKTYRKAFTTPLRAYIKVVERYMCLKDWDKIEYSKVPSCAMKRLKKAFSKNDPERFAEWQRNLELGNTTVKGAQLFPHELIHEVRTKHHSDPVCEGQWRVLEEMTAEMGSLTDSIAVCDVSPSMQSWTSTANRKLSFTPMDVGMAISLLIGHVVKGAFHNHIITFDDTPTFHLLKDGSLLERYRALSQAKWGHSTNLQAVFDLILTQAKKHKLKAEDLPKRIFIVSDMQFDVAIPKQGHEETNFSAIDAKYKASGYSRPQLVFWNVNGESSDYPVTVNEQGTAMISGFSTSVMKAILDGSEFTPLSIMRNTLDSDRYKPVMEALNMAGGAPPEGSADC
jgi:hypothetical protein